MDDEKIKHLELVQSVISRMAQNCFACKGWAVALVAAMFAFATKDADPRYSMLAVLPALVFWGLDGYYLRQERLFRKLYDAVRKPTWPPGDDDAFSMDTSPYSGIVDDWLRTCCRSGTIVWLYLALLVVILFVTLGLAPRAGG